MLTEWQQQRQREAMEYLRVRAVVGFLLTAVAYGMVKVWRGHY